MSRAFSSVTHVRHRRGRGTYSGGEVSDRDQAGRSSATRPLEFLVGGRRSSSGVGRDIVAFGDVFPPGAMEHAPTGATFASEELDLGLSLGQVHEIIVRVGESSLASFRGELPGVRQTFPPSARPAVAAPVTAGSARSATHLGQIHVPDATAATTSSPFDS